MKKEILISTLVATLAFSVVGCGSSGSKKDDNKTVDDGKKTTNYWTAREVDNLKVERNKQSGDVKIFFKHGINDKVTQFFIDTDNNKATGSTEFPIGVEYKIVNSDNVKNVKNSVYEVNTSKRESWVKSNKTVDFTSSISSVVIPKAIIPSQYFTVHTEAYALPTPQADDVNWSDVKSSEKLTFDMKTVGSNPTTFTSTSGLKMKVESNATDMSIILSGESFTERTTIYIDSNDSDSVGFATEWQNFKADYYIDVNSSSLMKFDSSKDDNRTFVKNISSFITDKEKKFNFSKSDIGSPTQKIKIGTAVYSSTWAPIGNKTIPVKTSAVNALEYTLSN